jgi:AcrR family transcriptional regulator
VTTAGKTWRRRKRERPVEIRAAALIEFSRGSFDTVTMECIACRAGVTKGTIYLYYANKGELFGSLQGTQGGTGAKDGSNSKAMHCGEMHDE